MKKFMLLALAAATLALIGSTSKSYELCCDPPPCYPVACPDGGK